jgi:hypothetical protein
MLRLNENKPRRQSDDPWRRRMPRRGRQRNWGSPSVKSLLVLATLLFACAALLYPNIELPGSLPTVHRHTSSDGFVQSTRNRPTLGDIDCAGGGGNGPSFVVGPVPVAPGDPHRLDRDGDGIGCEPK